MKTRILLVSLVGLFFTQGCTVPEDHAEWGDDALETRASELAIAGPWTIPTQISSTAASYDIDYTGAGPWRGTSGCSGTFTAGAQRLKDYIQANFPQVTSIGGYSCRPIVGNSSSMSVHATGRAIDIHIPLDGGAADNGLGDPLANWLVENAEHIGIQMVIWDRWLWSPSRTPYSRYYSGQHAHHDHLHVELTVEASRMETPWFTGGNNTPPPPQTTPGCNTVVGSSGAVIDETSPCFIAYGPNQYWRRVDGSGVSGSLLWTNAFTSSNPSNWAQWRFEVAASGRYKVEYHNVSNVAVYDSAQYRVRTGLVDAEVYIDQGADPSGWQEIGTFDFAANQPASVALYDNTNLSVASDQHIVFDAIRITAAGSRPVPGPDEDPVDPDPDDDQSPRPEDPPSGGGTNDGTGGTQSGGTTSGTTGGTTGGTDDGGSPPSPTSAPIGQTGDSQPPPKPAFDPDSPAPYPGETYDEPIAGDPGHFAFDEDVHAGGQVQCATTQGSLAHPLLLLVAFVIGGRRRRRR